MPLFPFCPSMCPPLHPSTHPFLPQHIPSIPSVSIISGFSCQFLLDLGTHSKVAFHETYFVCLCPTICLSVCLYVCMFVCLSTYLSPSLPVLSVYLCLANWTLATKNLELVRGLNLGLFSGCAPTIRIGCLTLTLMR